MIRGRILLQALIATAVIAALLSVIQLWAQPMEWVDFIRMMVTVVLIGVFASFLTAVDYDMPGSKRKYLLGGMVLTAALAIGLILVQIWWIVLQWIAFFKILGTVAILFCLVSFVLAVSEDFGSQKKLKDEKYID